ncbi:MAG: isoprenyl transferase [Thiotrichaceae bacterium]|nr:isoprenyl transferase [Thiotrichaceae bacterium]PCI14525.1 MAG: di-trans,poly-cis-decaprenylcistransferase [Thiotrichales bacterium]
MSASKAEEAPTTEHAGAMPRHIAIIMDGNGRWAKKRFMPRIIGHKAGVETVRAMVRHCAEKKIEVLTLFAFSSENWRRPAKEVRLLLELFVTALKREVKRLNDNNVVLKVVGDREAFPDALQKEIANAEAMTSTNTGLKLVVAANYGGRWDIVQATRALALEVASGKLDPTQIDEAALDRHLSLYGMPEPDLFIRTGGEERVSNFLLWQLAYCEMHFTETLWPDFDGDALDLALNSFSKRQRRFGRTGDQLEQGKNA